MSVYKFGDLVKEVKNKVDRDNNPYQYYVAGDDMDSEDLRIHRKGSFVTDDVGPAFVREFRKGQVLYGSRRTYLKKVAVADFDGVTSNVTFVLETKDNSVLLQSILPFLMLSDGFTKWSISKSKGSTNPYVLFKDLAEYSVDLPSIEEQKYLSRLLWQFFHTMESYKELIHQADEIVKARFVEMFGDFTTNPMNWPVKPFIRFAKIDANMTTDYQKYADYPHIGIDSIEKDTGRLVGYRTVKEDNVKSGKYIFTSQHIIYSKIRPNLNKVALPDFDGLCSADAYPILPNPANCNRIFLANVMRSQYFLNYIVPFSDRSNMPKVNRKQIEGFSMPLPPLQMQNEFAEFVAQVDKSKASLQQALHELEVMYKRIIKENLG